MFKGIGIPIFFVRRGNRISICEKRPPQTVSVGSVRIGGQRVWLLREDRKEPPVVIPRCSRFPDSMFGRILDHLRLSIRQSNPDLAVRSFNTLLQIGEKETLLVVPRLVLEEGMVHPHLPLLIWMGWVCGGGRTADDIQTIAQLVRDVAQCGVKMTPLQRRSNTIPLDTTLQVSIDLYARSEGNRYLRRIATHPSVNDWIYQYNVFSDEPVDIQKTLEDLEVTDWIPDVVPLPLVLPNLVPLVPGMSYREVKRSVRESRDRSSKRSIFFPQAGPETISPFRETYNALCWEELARELR